MWVSEQTASGSLADGILESENNCLLDSSPNAGKLGFVRLKVGESGESVIRHSRHTYRPEECSRMIREHAGYITVVYQGAWETKYT